MRILDKYRDLNGSRWLLAAGGGGCGHLADLVANSQCMDWSQTIVKFALSGAGH